MLELEYGYTCGQEMPTARRPDPDEMILINYGYARSNWNIATISNPSAKLSREEL
ncbi:MAG: hypothetical protein QXT13_12730 [Pyrobaculum sp.]